MSDPDNGSTKTSLETTNKPPDTAGTDPEERKLARLLRIKRRLEAARRHNLTTSTAPPDETKQTLVEKRIDDSWELLQKKILTGDEYISNVRVAADSRECQRRNDLLAEQKRTAAKLEAEAQIAEDMFQKVSANWHELTISTDPLHIDNGLQQQKIKCDELLKRKNDLIAALDNELKFKDVRYVKEERLMKQDMKVMADRIDKQAILMRKAFEHELQMITEAIVTERLEVLAANKARANQLFELHDTTEAENLNKKMEAFRTHEHEMYRLLQTHQEQYRELKRSLSSDIENLQKELQNLRALCLINSETMDYNYQVLKRREDENIMIKSSQTRKINKLQDEVNRMKRKINRFTEESETEIRKLTDDVLKLNSNIMDIERKAEHFAKVNDLKYREVWEMNSNEAKDLLKRILDIDRIVYEQLLGLNWKIPVHMIPGIEVAGPRNHPTILKEMGLQSVDLSPKKSEPDEVAKTALLNRLFQLIANRSDYLIEDRLTVLLAPFAENDRNIINLDNVFAALQIKKEEDIDLLLSYMLPYTYCAVCTQIKSTPSSSTVEIEIISTEFPTDFEKIVADHPSGAATISKAPTTGEILSTLNHPQELVKEIISTFGQPLDRSFVEHESVDTSQWSVSSSKASSAKSPVVPGSEMSAFFSKDLEEKDQKTRKFRCSNGHILTINPAYIIKGIKDFSIHFNTEKEQEQETIAARLTRSRTTVGRSITEQDINNYWLKFRVVFPEKSIQVWDSLIIALKKYHRILKDRKDLCIEVVRLRKQNAECRQILRDLLKISDDQYLPPLTVSSSASIASGVSTQTFQSISSKRSKTKYRPKFKYRAARV